MMKTSILIFSVLIMTSCFQDKQVSAYKATLGRVDMIRIFHRKGDSLMLYETITDNATLQHFRDIFSTGIKRVEPVHISANIRMDLFCEGKQIMLLEVSTDPERNFINALGNGFSMTIGMTYRMGMFMDGP